MFNQVFNQTTVTAALSREVLTKAEHKIYNYLSNRQCGRAQTDQIGQEEMAAAFGLSREHVNRSIGRMVERGLLLIRRQYQVLADGRRVMAENIYVVVRNIYHHLAEWRVLQKLRAGWLHKRRKKAAQKKQSPSDKIITAFHDSKFNRAVEIDRTQLTEAEDAILREKYLREWRE